MPHTAPRSILLRRLPSLSGLRGLRVLRVNLEEAEGGEEDLEAGVLPAGVLATLARSHPALEAVRVC